MGRPKKTPIIKPSSLMKKSLKMAQVRHNPYSKGDSNGGNLKNQPTSKKTVILDDDFTSTNPKTKVSAEHYLIPQLKNGFQELPFNFSQSNVQKFSANSLNSSTDASSSKSRYLSKPAKSPPKDMFEFRKKLLDEKRANKSRIESKYPIKSTKESIGGARSSTNQFTFLSRQDLVKSSNRSSNSSSARSSTSRSSFGGSKAKTSTPSSNHFYLHTRQQDLLRSSNRSSNSSSRSSTSTDLAKSSNRSFNSSSRASTSRRSRISTGGSGNEFFLQDLLKSSSQTMMSSSRSQMRSASSNKSLDESRYSKTRFYSGSSNGDTSMPFDYSIDLAFIQDSISSQISNSWMNQSELDFSSQINCRPEVSKQQAGSIGNNLKAENEFSSSEMMEDKPITLPKEYEYENPKLNTLNEFQSDLEQNPVPKERENSNKQIFNIKFPENCPEKSFSIPEDAMKSNNQAENPAVDQNDQNSGSSSKKDPLTYSNIYDFLPRVSQQRQAEIAKEFLEHCQVEQMEWENLANHRMNKTNRDHYQLRHI